MLHPWYTYMHTLQLGLQAGKENIAAFLETRRTSAYLGGTTEGNKCVLTTDQLATASACYPHSLLRPGCCCNVLTCWMHRCRWEGITYDAATGTIYTALSTVEKAMEDSMNQNKPNNGTFDIGAGRCPSSPFAFPPLAPPPLVAPIALLLLPSAATGLVLICTMHAPLAAGGPNDIRVKWNQCGCVYKMAVDPKSSPMLATTFDAMWCGDDTKGEARCCCCSQPLGTSCLHAMHLLSVPFS